MAQTRLRDLFIAMPDSLLPILTKVNREDCVDFLEAGMEAHVRNRFDGETVMDSLTDNYLHLRYTTVSEVEMRLAMTTDSVGCVWLIHRVQTPQPDCMVHVFDTSWREISPRKAPRPTDFLPDTLSHATFGFEKAVRE